MIALPGTAMMLAILFFLWRSIHAFTGLDFDEALAPSPAKHH